jgi:hypothetical protein
MTLLALWLNLDLLMLRLLLPPPLRLLGWAVATASPVMACAFI